MPWKLKIRQRPCSLLICDDYVYFWEHQIDATRKSIQEGCQVSSKFSSRPDWWSKRCPIIVNILCIYIYLAYLVLYLPTALRTYLPYWTYQCIYIYTYTHIYYIYTRHICLYIYIYIMRLLDYVSPHVTDMRIFTLIDEVTCASQRHSSKWHARRSGHFWYQGLGTKQYRVLGTK